MSNNRNKKHKKAIGAGYRPPFPDSVLQSLTSELEIREDTQKLLQGGGLVTMNDVLVREEKDFYRIPTFNKKNLLDLKSALKKRNLFLRPTPEEKSEEKENPKEEKGNPKPDTKKEKINPNNKNEGKNGGKPGKEQPRKPQPEKKKEESDRYVKVNKGGKWGFRDREGNQKVAPLYDEVFCYKEDLCCVEKDDKFGFINREGEEIIPIVYDCAVSFSEGYACVFKGEKCGYINTKNEVVIDFRFDAGTPIQNGECRVKRDGKWGELHIENPSEIRWIN